MYFPFSLTSVASLSNIFCLLAIRTAFAFCRLIAKASLSFWSNWTDWSNWCDMGDGGGGDDMGGGSGELCGGGIGETVGSDETGGPPASLCEASRAGGITDSSGLISLMRSPKEVAGCGLSVVGCPPVSLCEALRAGELSEEESGKLLGVLKELKSGVEDDCFSEVSRSPKLVVGTGDGLSPKEIDGIVGLSGGFVSELGSTGSSF